MATQSTGGGSTTSFTNTPQAKDDVYNYLENLLVSDSTIYNTTTNTVTLDVMSNDLGGNAKTLFSVEDGDGNALTADFDLLAKDVNAAGCSPWEETLNHNWVRINNGKIEYRIADGSGIPGHGVSVDSLTAGQDFNDQFVYAIRLGNGTLSEATVKIHITGANDAATISVVTAETAAVEAGGDANAVPGDPNASGQLLVTDADAGENKFQTPPSLDGAYGTFTFDANTGVWAYLLNNGLALTEELNQGDHVTDTLTVKSYDGSATYTITVNITGSNDDPVATADVAVATEDGATVTGSVATNDHDVDSSAVLGFTVNGAAPAGFAMAANGGWTFDPTNGAYDHIAQGAHEDVVVSYTVTDEHGASDTATLTITVNGVNDTPDAQDDAKSGAEDTTISGTVATNDSDADDGAVLGYALVNPAPAGLTFHGDGSWSLDASDPAYQHIAEGAHEDVVVSYTVTDEHGASDTATLTITVNGVNDTPDAQDDAKSGAEDTTISGTVATNASDADDGATLGYALVNPAPAGLTFNGDGSWSLDASDPAYQHIAQGAHQDVVVSYTVTDEHGASDSATLTITVNGVNDDPVALDDAKSGAEDTTISGSVATNDSDADDGAVLGYALVNPAPAGLTFNGDGSWSLDASDLAYQHIAEGAHEDVVVSYTVTDEHGASDSATLTITVNGVNDDPELSASVTDHTYVDTAADDSFSNLSGTLSTVDPDDGDTAAYSVSGGAADISLAGYDTSAASTYGTLYLNSSTGAYRFVPDDAAIEALKGDDSVGFTVSVTDSQGASDSETLTINLDGANDTPELSATLTAATFTDTAGDDSFSAVSGDLSSTDRDSPETATYSVLGGVSDNSLAGYDTSKASAFGTLYVDSASGNYTFVPDDGAIEGLKTDATLFFTLNVTDGSGASDSETLTINLDGTNDLPELGAVTGASYDDTAADDSFADVTGTLTSTDRDSGDSASYSVSGASATAEPGFDQEVVTGYGTLYLDSASGNYKFVPDDGAIEGLKSTDHVDFTVTVTDGSGATDSDTLTVTLNGVNDTPDAPATNSVTTDEDTASSPMAIDASDRDAGETFVYSVKTSEEPSIGSVSFDQGAGTFTYTPDPDANGGDSFTIVITDASGATTEQVVSVTVNPVNDDPVSAGGSGSTDEDLALNGSLPAASDVDGDSVAYALDGQATHGTAAVNADGTFTYTPDENFNGDDSFTFTVSDGNGGSNTYAYDVTVNPVNDDPVNTLPASFTTNEDTSVQLTGLSVADVDAGSGTVSVTLGVASGSLTALSGGGVGVSGSGTGSLVLSGALADINAYLASGSSPTYVPVANANGAVTLTMTTNDGGNSGAGGPLSDTDTSTINITAVNDAPAGADNSKTIAEDGSYVFTTADFGFNDGTDGDGFAGAKITTLPTDGTLLLSGVAVTAGQFVSFVDLAVGNLKFVPDANENGAAYASFTFQVQDTGGTANGGVDLDQSPNTFTFNVTAVNDAPTLQAVASGSIAEVDQSSSTTSSGLSGTLVGADVDGDTLIYGVVGGTVAAGVSTLVNTYGTLTVDTLTGAYNFAPNAAAIEGLDVGENPAINFTMTVSDGDAPLGTQTYTINVTGADDTPTLAAVTSGSIAEVNQSSSTTSSGLSGTLVGSDVDSETLTYGVAGGTVAAGVSTLVGTYGTLTVNTSTGAYNFTPDAAAIEALDAGENPSVNFTMTVSDGDAPLGTQTYAINLTGADDTPTLAAVTSGSIAEVSQSSSTTSSGLSGTLVGSDVDSETLAYGIQGGSASGVNQVSLAGSYGTLTVNTVTGAYSYAPNSPAIEALNVGQNPSDAFTVTVSDGDAPLGTQSYTVNLTGANDAAVITGAVSGSITEDAVPNTVGGDLNSTDVDNANDSWNAVVAATGSANGYGTYTMDAAGNWVYALNNANPTVNALNNGGTLSDSFTVTTADGTSQIVNITINGHTDAVDVQAPTDILFNLNPASSGFSGNGLGSGDVLGSFTAVDADSTAWTFTLGGTNASSFSLSPGGSQSAVNIAAASAIASGNYTFTVTATDGAGHSITETYHVGVGTTNADSSGVGNLFTITTGTDVDFGLNGDDVINGGGGDDALVGGPKDDTITGGLGADQLIGGQGDDTFVYTATNESTAASHDTIFDFEEAGSVDVISLTAIDANLSVANDQAFVFDAVQNAGVVNNHVTWYQDAAHNQTVVQADNNGDGVADLVITLVGIHSLTSGDFGL